MLLGTLVGGAGIVAGSAVLARSRYARLLSVLFRAGLFGFEVVEACWIGLQPLELVFGAVGAGIAAVAIRAPLGTWSKVTEMADQPSLLPARSAETG